jgi:predicted CDP-diglyceride synthetase/phosphatidate cytidylyltransferase
MHPTLILQFLILLTLANGTPVIAKKLLGDKFAQPLDGHTVFLDGRPLLGPSKTIRGIVLSILVTALCAPLIGLDWNTGFVVAIMAMTGDLFSSFLKRRMNLAPSSRATGLDQIPESLFPTLACRSMLQLSVSDIFTIVIIFFVGEVILSRLLFKLGIRDRPF